MTIVQKIKAKAYAWIFWQTGIGEVLNKINDLRIFYKYSFIEKKLKGEINFQAYLTKQYHIVEKGMALPNPRPNFGKAKIITLVKIAKEFEEKYGNRFPIANIKSTLSEYLERNKSLKSEDVTFYSIIFNYIGEKENFQRGSDGVKKMVLSDINKIIDIDFESFIKSRTSVRDFSSKNVTVQDITAAVNIARHAPSVCNRQSWKVHSYQEVNLKNQLLKIQNGNNGFTESIHTLLIVTTDTKKFTKHESNQVFVDGGLFAMNLLLSLHSQGLGSCCLNNCFPFVIENKVKKLANIPESERLIMMIGIGKYKDDFLVATSYKLPAEQILNVH